MAKLAQRVYGGCRFRWRHYPHGISEWAFPWCGKVRFAARNGSFRNAEK